MSEELVSTIYRQNAESLWLSDSNAVFGNGKAEHAAILYETFLKLGKHELLMLVKNLSKEVFGSIEMEALAVQALSKGMRIDVICQQEPVSPKISENIHSWQERGLPISLKVCRKGDPAASLEANFAVVDGRAYRFEKDRESTIAVACMNDVKSAQKLREVFFRLKSAA
jgi:hypothetical protein